MKKALLLLPLLLTGCFKNGYAPKEFSNLPPELADCKFFYIHNSDGAGMYAARCGAPTTSLSYTSGKATKHVIIVDGVKYVEQEASRGPQN